MIADSARTNLESMTPDVLGLFDRLADNLMRCVIVGLAKSSSTN